MSQSDSMSAEDLRNKLYHSLREKGLVDSLKSQLRNRLVTELQTSGLGKSQTQSNSIYAEEGSLITRAANSLVADHLKFSSYDYTFSVFLPESGISEDKIFTSKDLLRLLNISSESSLYKKLVKYNTGLDKRGFLWQLLCEVSKQHGRSKSDTGIQTDKAIMPLVTSLQDELQKLDDHYASAEVAQGTRWGVEERMLTYQRQLEERSRTEYNLEVSRFKDTELTRMRIEERDKHRKELEKSRKELERTYQAKLDALIERERNSIERLQQQQDIQEKETYSQRQSILEEIDIVRQREAELRRQMELNLREKNLWEDKMKTREEAAKIREDAVRRAEVDYEKRLREQVNTYKTEQEAKYLTRNKDIEYREIRLKEDERRVSEELADIKSVKDELREKRIRVNTLDADVERAKHDVLTLRNQNELLSSKLREMVDYQVMKDENSGLRQDLDNTKTRLSETQRDLQIERQKREELLREMGERLSKPTPEALLLQTELDKARGALRHEQALYQHQQQQSQIRMNEQTDRGRDMMRKYEEQSLQMKEMNQEIRDLRHQLTHTRSALDNEVYGKPKSGLSRRSRSPSFCDLGDRDFDLDTQALDPGVFNTTEPELLFTKDIDDGEGASPRRGEVSKSEDYSYSSDIIEDTKKRLRNLEREAENLEQNYQNFHFRMSSVHASLPPTATSIKSAFTGVTRGTANTNHSARPSYSSPRATLTLSDRPRSSTPTRKPHPASYRPYTPPMEQEDLPRLNMDVSPVQSTSHKLGRSTAIRSNQPITLDDLEARPGSPSVVVVEGSHHLPNITPTDDDTHHPRSSPSGQERSERSDTRSAVSAPRVELDSAWKSVGNDGETLTNTSPSADTVREGPLTSTQKTTLSQEERRRQEAADREQREAEDREYEERRRQREEERKRREEERWEQEQRELERLESGNKKTTPRAEPEKAPEESGPAIDPVMQKYMEMVAAQKTREKAEKNQLAKKTISTWNKGRTMSEDKTPSLSEEISAADKSDGGGAAEFDDDFDW